MFNPIWDNKPGLIFPSCISLGKESELEIETKVKRIKSFLEKNSDFSFETRVMETLSKMGFFCKRSGTYVDPIQQKKKQYGIFAYYENGIKHLKLSLECKNLKKEEPLVILSVPRKVHEAYHTLMYKAVRNQEEDEFGSSPTDSKCSKFRILPRGFTFTEKVQVKDFYTPYRMTRPVGKSMQRIPLNMEPRQFEKDEVVFDPMTQAVNSALALIEESYFFEPQENHEVHLIIPVLVVPDGTLWEVKFNERGEEIGEPQPSKYCQFYVDQKWQVRNDQAEILFRFHLSHLEIVTFSEIEDIFYHYLNFGSQKENYFPMRQDYNFERDRFD